MRDPGRMIGDLALRSLSRGQAQRRRHDGRARAHLGDLAGVDFSRPLPPSGKRAPAGLVPALVVVAVLLMVMFAATALRLR